MKLLQGRSRGAIALARLGRTQAALARQLGRSRSLVGHWMSGRRPPTVEDRALMAEELGIDAALWDQFDDPKTKATKNRPAPSPRPRGDASARSVDDGSQATGGSVRARARRLEVMVQDLLEGLRHTPGVTPLEQAKVMASAASTLTLLGRLTGETSEISEARILRMPAWRRIQGVLLDALKPYPEALMAAGEALQRFDEDV